jgi:hypothetical protein
MHGIDINHRGLSSLALIDKPPFVIFFNAKKARIIDGTVKSVMLIL